jgi:flagellar basal body rod protein FlgG
VTTPAGERYTRNGSFMRRADGVLTTADGLPVLGAGTPSVPIKVGTGQISISDDGTVKAGDTIAGKLKLVSFESEDDVERETGTRFRAKAGKTPTVATARIVGGSLEQSNVTMVDRMVALTETQRGFEAMQKGISVLFNDIDARAINELGHR